MAKIIIGADIVPTVSNRDLFAKGDATAILGDELKAIIDNSDFVVANLETPIYDGNSPILKCGPNLKCATDTAKGLKALGIDLLTLANNHILDHGKEGLKSTFETLDKEGIPYIGAGWDEESARAPFIIELGGKKVGFYTACQHEFSWIQDYGYGANGFVDLDSPAHIAELRQKVDYLIVLYHAGIEEHRYPTVYVQKVCRKMVDMGADLVICQHTHCVCCQEKYKNSTIVYGQGNFIFGDLKAKEEWKTSILVQVELNENGSKIEYIPIENNGVGVNLSKDESILNNYYERSEEIKKEGVIQEKMYIRSKTMWLWFKGGMHDAELSNMCDSDRMKLLNWLTNEVHVDLLRIRLSDWKKDE